MAAAAAAAAAGGGGARRSREENKQPVLPVEDIDAFRWLFPRIPELPVLTWNGWWEKVGGELRLVKLTRECIEQWCPPAIKALLLEFALQEERGGSGMPRVCRIQTQMREHHYRDVAFDKTIFCNMINMMLYDEATGIPSRRRA